MGILPFEMNGIGIDFYRYVIGFGYLFYIVFFVGFAINVVNLLKKTKTIKEILTSKSNIIGVITLIIIVFIQYIFYKPYTLKFDDYRLSDIYVETFINYDNRDGIKISDIDQKEKIFEIIKKIELKRTINDNFSFNSYNKKALIYMYFFAYKDNESPYTVQFVLEPDRIRMYEANTELESAVIGSEEEIYKNIHAILSENGIIETDN